MRKTYTDAPSRLKIPRASNPCYVSFRSLLDADILYKTRYPNTEHFPTKSARKKMAPVILLFRTTPACTAQGIKPQGQSITKEEFYLRYQVRSIPHTDVRPIVPEGLSGMGAGQTSHSRQMTTWSKQAASSQLFQRKCAMGTS